MRPLRLVVEGFGTYLKRQDLDFTLLKDKNIFVITGDTGAGKTTIFDAINYALYGDASGKEREGISFRSDFARPDEPSSVELWFAIRDEVYYVKREPSYMEKKQRGEGEKEHKAYAELILPGGKVITGIKPVTLEIEKLLGINKDQFRQIVMIPQGEFKKLLTADSQEREKIFRKIFGTDIFERIQQRITTKANELDKEVKFKRNERDAKLKDFDCKETDEELYRMLQSGLINLEEVFKRAEAVIKEEVKVKEQVDKQMVEIEGVIEKLNKELVQGEAVNKKFEDRVRYEQNLKLLEDRIETYKEKRDRLGRARKALTLKGFEEKWAIKQKAFKMQDEALVKEKELSDKLQLQYHEVSLRFEAEKKKENEKKDLEKALHEAEKLIVKAKKYDSSKALVLTLQKEGDRLKQALMELNLYIEKSEQGIRQFDEALEQVAASEKEEVQLQGILKELNSQSDELSFLGQQVEKTQKEQEKHQQLIKKFEEADLHYETAKKKYEVAEDTFRKGQAGILAKALLDGTPCPVCGSLEHPSPAVLLDETINEEVVDKAKAAYEAQRLLREEYINKLTELNTNINSALAQSIRPLAEKLLQVQVIDSLQELYLKVTALISQNKELRGRQEERIKTLKESVGKKVHLLDQKAKLQENLVSAKEKAKTDSEAAAFKQEELSAAKEQLRMIEEEFEGKVKTGDELLEETRQIREKLEAYQAAYKRAEEAYTNLSKALSEAKGKVSSIEANLRLLTTERDEALQLFKDKTLTLGFADYKDYKACCMSEEEIDALDQNIQQFDANLEAGRKLHEKACLEVKDLVPVQLEDIKEKLKLYLEEKNKTIHRQQVLFARVQNNQKVLKEAKGLSDKIKTQEEKYRLIGDLAKVVKGDNEYKISFERYVLAAYFDDIVEASNVRFGKMTGGRFELLRKTQKGDARSQQGLDLEVMDNYTGKARPVDTLSGGESFKASLAMALGLADVVQSYAGGIQLDTMFVDEGFGTLDPESLENAISCLVGLQQSGRLVGIISHVPELKERIDARLEVKRVQRGSQAVFKL